MIQEVATFAQDVEMKTVTVGDVEKSVLNNRVAIFNDKDRTTFVNVTAWGKLAEYIAANYKKGDEVCFEGNLRNGTHTVEDRTFQTTFILMRTVKLTFGRKSKRIQFDDEYEADVEIPEDNYENNVD